jgi:hypoxanthine phosphoribosyltransferase
MIESNNSMPQKTKYSWDAFHSFVLNIKRQLPTKPDIIVSIGKGGSIPGVILAEAYNINNLNLGLKSYSKYDRGKIHEYQSLHDFENLRDLNILLVDDIADSGATFKYSVNMLNKNYCDHVQTASVFYKPCSVFKPDYYGTEVDESVWIVQPWEEE